MSAPRRAAEAATPAAPTADTAGPVDVAGLRARIETNLRVYQHRVDNGTATDFDQGKRAAFQVVLSMLEPRGEPTFSCGRAEIEP